MKKYILFFMAILAITGCSNKTPIDNADSNTNSDNNVKEEITNINTNSKYQEDKIVDGLRFTNASLVSIDNNALFEVTIKNETTTVAEFKNIKITLLDEENNKIVELTGMIGNNLNVGEEKVISCYYNGEIDKVTDVNYEIVK